MGVILTPSGSSYKTIEPPWDANKPNVSCIPDGEYVCRRDRSGRFKFFSVTNVPERSHIEIHPANNYVNPIKGKQEPHGCIALGQRIGDSRMVLNSRSACSDFLLDVGDSDFHLERSLSISRLASSSSFSCNSFFPGFTVFTHLTGCVGKHLISQPPQQC
ncbi:DUF5675 family protein [Pseudoteredinibacter isoporae]|uniref:DUF5675 family protein n=1 Tax=Pseudoteredinibacter isoporae TaxID=570281 RepID=UPI00333EFDEC